MERLAAGGRSSVCGSLSGLWRRGSFSSFQGSLLWFLIFTSQITWAVSERDRQIIVDSTTGVWDKTLLKDTERCSRFHAANTTGYFFYWPEDNFKYCCQDVSGSPQNNLTDYRYSTYGTSLNTASYYDLGLVDKCLPYYRCLYLYDRYMEQPVYYTVCEYTDIIHLFTNRFWRLVVGKYGLATTALPLIVTLQLAVFLAIALEVVYWRYWRSKVMDKTDMSSRKLKKIYRIWFFASWKNACMDWLHLCLLSIIGNGLVEAVSRQDPYTWQSKTFYRYSTVYLSLSVILWLSSFLHQVTQWIAVDKKITKKMEKIMTMKQPPGAASRHPAGETRIQIESNPSGNSTNANKSGGDHEGVLAELREYLKRDTKDTKKDPVAELRKLLNLGPDWKWQPIAAQTAILFCLWAYLTYPSDDGLSSTLLGFLVQAASPWSGLYACRVLFLTLPFLLKKVFNVKHMRHLLCSRKAKVQASQGKAKPEWLQWGRVLCCLGCCWKGSRSQERRIDPESSSESDE